MPRAPAAQAVQLPSGRHGLDRAFVISNQRDRILDAIASEIAAKGYGAVTVADVCRRARVSSRTFYELFSDKAECFLAAYDAAIEALMAQVASVFQEMPEATPERARAVLARVLELFAREPDFARMCLVEVNAAGEDAARRYAGVIESFLALVDQIQQYEESRRHRPPVRPDTATRQAVVGGIAWVIHLEVVAGRTRQLPELLPQLTYILLAPFIGPRAAARTAFGRQPRPARTRRGVDGRPPRRGVDGRPHAPGG